MEKMKVEDLVAAVKFVGDHYRNKDGSKPADAVLKLLSQLRGYEAGTLSEWAKQQENSRASNKKKLKVKIDQKSIREILASLDRVSDQNGLTAAIQNLDSELSAEDWKAIARDLSGKLQGSGKASRAFIETHFSNSLLLKNRLESVKRVYG
jgi:reverse gyrase